MSASVPVSLRQGRPLAPMQRALWMSQRRYPAAPMQNMAKLSHLDAPIDAQRLVEAFASVVAASDTLSTRIIDEGPTPMMVPVLDEAVTEIIDVDRSEAQRWARDRVQAPVDPTVRPYDSVILRHEDRTVSWYLALHHVVTDAASSALVFGATSAAYHGDAISLTPYFDWVDIAAADESAKVQRARQYWAERTPAEPIARLYRPVRRQTPDSLRVPVSLGDGLGEQLDGAAAGDYRLMTNELSWSALLVTATAILLHKVGRTNEFSVGLPVHNRSGASAKQVIGTAMEVFPVDVHLDAEDTFRSLHKRIGRSVMQTLRYAMPGHAPTGDFEAVVNVIPAVELGPFGAIAARHQVITSGSVEPGHLLVAQLNAYGENGRGLVLDINRAAAGDDHVLRAHAHFSTILSAMVTNPDLMVGQLDIRTPDERAAVTAWATGRDFATPTPSIVESLRVALAERDDTVLDDGANALTGRGLWMQATRLATQLRAEGVGAGGRVGIQMPRSIDAVVAMLATLIAGGSYVPLDPDQPVARLRDLATRAECLSVLTQIDVGPREGEAHLFADPSLDDEAYLLFTSGSTGEPKGVPISHRGLARYIRFAAENYVQAGQRPVVALFSALTFDLTVTSIFVPLVTGGRVVVIEPNGGAGLAAVAARPDVTWIKATPSHLEVLVPMLGADHALETFVVGGEAFGSSLARRMRQGRPDIAIFNEYGPTEAVVGCMVHRSSEAELDGLAEVPIGRPAPGVTLAVVDDLLAPVPLGAQGELCTSHVGLTAGYLGSAGSPDEEPFIDLDGRRFYRSGDLVRMDDDETLIYLGRIDDQVKVGGIRLEPTEVEEALESHHAVSRATVRLWSAPPSEEDTEATTSPSAVLVAWFTHPAEFSGVTNIAELRAFAAQTLPAHAVPVAFVAVDELPMTTNGKLDTARLPAPERVHRSGGSLHVEPETDEQSRIAAIWEEVLGLAPVGIDDDFFALGGDSFAAMQMVALLGERESMAIAEELAFVYTTVRELADVVEHRSAPSTEAGPVPLRRGPTEPPPLSVGESSILFDQQVHPGDARYNVGRVYRIHGDVDASEFGVALRTVAQRHISLCWTFGATRRRLGFDEAVDFDVASVAVTPSQVNDALRRDHRRPFDLDNGPLLRATVQPVTDGSTAVLVVIHHVVGDADSFSTIWKQVEAVYSGKEIVPTTLDAPSFSAWQAASISQADRDYWDASGQPLAALEIQPPFTPGPDGFAKRVASFSAAELQTGSITGFARALASLAAVLGRRSDADRVGLGVIASTRTHVAADGLVGYFLNTLPLEIECPSSCALDELASRVSRQAGLALAHRTVPLADIVAARRAVGTSMPAIDVLLAYDDLSATSFGSHQVDHHVMFNGTTVAETATVFVEIRDGHVDLSMEYRGTRLSEVDADLLLQDLDAMILAGLNQPACAVGAVVLPSTADAVLVGPTLDPPATVLDAIVANIAGRPHEAAVVAGGDRLTWDELGVRAAEISELLSDGGVGAGSRVALCLRRSTDVVAGIVAVMGLGASYVPLDPTYPSERIQRTVDLAGVCVALVHGDAPALTDNDIVLGPRPQGAPAGAFSPGRVAADDEAYIIFTSGSTGTPRGVPVSHGQLAASTAARYQAYGSAPDRFLVISSLAFDSSVAGLFWALTSGGTVVLPTDSEAHDPDALLELFATQEITHTLLVPTLYQALLERGAEQSGWPSQVIVAGEACPPRLVNRHFEIRRESSLANEYGPTECTVWATVHHCGPDDAATPIGPPIAGTWVAVVGGDDKPVPIGVRGELIIGGAGVVEGYLGDDGATAERFGVDDRLGRFFRTRDRAVIVDGTVHFLGRSDNQLNLGGVRAEPEEIERVLLDVGGVGAAVVVAVDSRPLSELIESAPPPELSIAMARAATADDPALALASALREFDEPDLTLVAHVEASAGGDVDVAALRARAQRDLPAALRPRRFVVHTSLPRSPMGKIDRAQVALLPIPDDDIEPRLVRGGDDQATATVCRLFRETLRISAVGDQDSFFDLGGHSLLALQLLARLNDVFDTELSVATLYDAPTPAALADVVGARSAPQARLEYVVPIQPKGTRTPLFGVHVLGPNAEYYRPLSNRLGPDQPLYGLGLATGLEDAGAPTQVDEIAMLYVGEIERVAPEGPIALAAVSLGAVVAFELAQILRDRGRDVALIALFDATGPEAQVDAETSTHWLRAHAEEFRTGAVQYFRDRRSNLNLRAERGRERLEISLRELVHAPLPDRLKIRQFIEANVAAALAHEVSPYPGPICVFKAEEDPFGWGRGDAKLGWGSVAIGSFNVVDVPGGHMSMLAEPHVGALARAVTTELGRKATTEPLEELATADAIASRLRRALHGGTFSAAVADLARSSRLDTAAADLVARADTALRSVADHARAERGRIAAAFEGASVHAVVGEVPNRLEHASLAVTVDDPDRAIAALVGLGYVVQHPMSPGAWRAYKRRHTSVTLITLDQATTRVHIVWGDDAETRGLQRLTTPTAADLAALDLPGWAWPAYWAIRPGRLVADRIAGRRAGGDLGPYLGTPTAMVTPILRVAEIDADDFLVDIGCGDARVLIEAARSFGCRGRGIERDPELAATARYAVRRAGLAERIEIIEADANETDMSDITVAFAFLPAEATASILPKALAAMPTGSRFVAHEQLTARWPIQPTRSELVVDGGVTVVSVWRVP